MANSGEHSDIPCLGIQEKIWRLHLIIFLFIETLNTKCMIFSSIILICIPNEKNGPSRNVIFFQSYINICRGNEKQTQNVKSGRREVPPAWSNIIFYNSFFTYITKTK